MSSKASRAAYKRCSETCQKVRADISEALEKALRANFGDEYSSKFLAELTDAAFDAALIHGTEPLRCALIECEDELLDAAQTLDIAESDLASYDHFASRWESYAGELEQRAESLQCQLDSIPST